MEKTLEWMVNRANIILGHSKDIDLHKKGIKTLQTLHDHIKNVADAYVSLKEVSNDNKLTRELLLLGILSKISTLEKLIEKLEDEIMAQPLIP